jgi:hypothetical protein
MKRWLVAILMACTAAVSAEVCEVCRSACGNQEGTVMAAPCTRARTCSRPRQQQNVCLDPNPFAHPFWLDANIYTTAQAKFRDPERSGERFQFTQWDAELSYLKQVNRCSGVLAGVGYRWTRMNWNNSSFIRHQRFEEIGAFIRGFSYALPCWCWKFGAGWWQQTYKLSNMGRYGMAELFAWGRYDYIPGRMGLHIGILSQPGKRKGFTRPIIGLDYKFRNGFLLDCIYPIDITLLYPVQRWLKMGLAARFNRARDRMRPDDIVPEGIIEYRDWGAELRAVVEPIKGICAEAYAGSTIWSFVRVTSQMNDRVVYRNLDSVFYYGGHVFLAY